MIISVDCGSTNMRCRLFDGMTLIDEEKRKAGVRNTAFTGTTDFLVTSLHDCVQTLLERNALRPDSVEVILSSGTLSSDVGIHTIPHVVLPAGAAESAAHAEVEVREDICPIPILFIPGVKLLPGAGEKDPTRRIEMVDSMSGEECETYGIMKLLCLRGPFTITLPGSYNKVFNVDADGRITTMKTGMCGEFIAAISEHTLLKKSLSQPVIKRILPEKLVEGYEYCRTHGVSPTLIKARNVILYDGWTEDESANFFVGAALADDIRIVLTSCRPEEPLYLGGGQPLKEIFRVLLEHAQPACRELVVIDDETAKICSNVGAMLVFEQFKKLGKF